MHTLYPAILVLAGVVTLLLLAVISLKLVVNFTTSANENAALNHNRLMINTKQEIARLKNLQLATHSAINKDQYQNEISLLEQKVATELAQRNQLLDPNVTYA